MMRLIIALCLSLLASTVDAQPPATREAAARSAREVRLFKVQSGYPAGRPGFVVDHIIPLCAGGPQGRSVLDVASNMQWQAQAKSYQKDIYERALCKALAAQGFVLTKRPPPEVHP